MPRWRQSASYNPCTSVERNRLACKLLLSRSEKRQVFTNQFIRIVTGNPSTRDTWHDMTWSKIETGLNDVPPKRYQPESPTISTVLKVKSYNPNFTQFFCHIWSIWWEYIHHKCAHTVERLMDWMRLYGECPCSMDKCGWGHSRPYLMFYYARGYSPIHIQSNTCPLGVFVINGSNGIESPS